MLLQYFGPISIIFVGKNGAEGRVSIYLFCTPSQKIMFTVSKNTCTD